MLVKKKDWVVLFFSYLLVEVLNWNYLFINFNNMILYVFSGVYVLFWLNRGEIFLFILFIFFGDWFLYWIVWDELVFVILVFCFKGDNKCVFNYIYCEWICKCYLLIFMKLVFNIFVYFYFVFICCMIVISEIFYWLVCKFDLFGKLDIDFYY